MGPLLLAVLEEADHLGDPYRALFGPPLVSVDPAQVGGAVRWGQVVDERGRFRGRVQCRGDVGGEVAALGPFGFEARAGATQFHTFVPIQQWSLAAASHHRLERKLVIAPLFTQM